MDWQRRVRDLMLADTSDLVDLARLAGRDPKTFYRDADLRGMRLTPAEREALGIDALEHTPQPPDHASAGTLDARIAGLVSDLDRIPRDTDPTGWAEAMIQLGTLLLQDGQERRVAGPIYSALDFYGSAQEVFCRKDTPLRWAEIEAQIGRAKTEIGRLTGRSKIVREAIEAIKTALKVVPRDTNPVAWADMQMLLGEADLVLGQRGSDRYIRAAIGPFRAAKDVYEDAEDVPKQIEATYGLALAELLRADASGKATQTPVWRFGNLLSKFGPMLSDRQFLLTTLALGRALIVHGRHGHTPSLRDGLGHLAEVEHAFAASDDWTQWATARMAMAQGFAASGIYSSALDAIEDALTVFAADSHPTEHDRAVALRTEYRRGATARTDP